MGAGVAGEGAASHFGVREPAGLDGHQLPPVHGERHVELVAFGGDERRGLGGEAHQRGGESGRGVRPLGPRGVQLHQRREATVHCGPWRVQRDGPRAPTSEKKGLGLKGSSRESLRPANASKRKFLGFENSLLRLKKN